MDALNLADSVDSALYVADEMRNGLGRRARQLGQAARLSVNDYLRDRVTVAVGTQYLIESEIGRGGMAVVYRATDLRLNRTVAIKVLPPDIAFNHDVRTRFIREAQTAAQLSHPEHRSDLQRRRQGRRGGSSTSSWRTSTARASACVSRARARGPWTQTVRVLRDVADALAYAHARGVVHRDIKPDNILIDRASGRPMVTDFGIARAAAGETRLTVTGVAVGTPAYMSPEQALGEREVDGRSDLYSLAVVGYHMLAGDTPFKAVNTPAMLVKHVSERPRPIRERRPEVPAYLAVAIDRALAKRPEDRWSDAAEFRDALDGAQASHRRAQAGRRRRRSRVPDVAIARRTGPSPEHAPPMPPFPVPPPGLSRQRAAPLVQGAAAAGDRRASRGARRAWFASSASRMDSHARFDERPLEDRVIAFRRSVMSWLGVIDAVLRRQHRHGPRACPWFLIPSGLMFLNVLRPRRLDLVRRRRADRRIQEGNSRQAARPARRAARRAARLPRPLTARRARRRNSSRRSSRRADVLAGPHGEAIDAPPRIAR